MARSTAHSEIASVARSRHECAELVRAAHRLRGAVRSAGRRPGPRCCCGCSRSHSRGHDSNNGSDRQRGVRGRWSDGLCGELRDAGLQSAQRGRSGAEQSGTRQQGAARGPDQSSGGRMHHARLHLSCVMRVECRCVVCALVRAVRRAAQLWQRDCTAQHTTAAATAAQLTTTEQRGTRSALRCSPPPLCPCLLLPPPSSTAVAVGQPQRRHAHFLTTPRNTASIQRSAFETGWSDTARHTESSRSTR